MFCQAYYKKRLYSVLQIFVNLSFLLEYENNFFLVGEKEK